MTGFAAAALPGRCQTLMPSAGPAWRRLLCGAEKVISGGLKSPPARARLRYAMNPPAVRSRQTFVTHDPADRFSVPPRRARHPADTGLLPLLHSIGRSTAASTRRLVTICGPSRHSLRETRRTGPSPPGPALSCSWCPPAPPASTPAGTDVSACSCDQWQPAAR